ncbi:hypothetical protein BGX34_010084 [Mortierella sp. NVP85]|nr:hypothetical protein BGX34_010084 [Mortierella sp. NVP85]
MDELDRELFGSSDSDSGSEVVETENDARQVDEHQELETDPIFQSIMEGPYDDMDGDGGDTSLSGLLTHAAYKTQPRHETHPQIPGLCLHTHVLSDADQAKLMSQITEKNFFKAGQQNQAMCFGERDLIWLEWLMEHMVEAGVLGESEWTSRKPLFDQSIMNLYYPGNEHSLLASSAQQTCTAADGFQLFILTGDGIKPHVDLARFEDGIVIISLLSAINMDFYPALNPMSPNDPPEGATHARLSVGENRKPSFTVRLEPGSIISMEGPARYEWEHGIQETMQDQVNDEWILRKIRVSVTLRKMRTSAWEVGPAALENGVADRK